MKNSVVAIGTDGFVQLFDELNQKIRGKALGFHNSWWRNVRFFHRDGYVYTVENVKPERHLGFFSKFLSYTIYNPTLWFQYRYLKVSTYPLSELRSAVANAVEKDDDVLTQHCERNELHKLISSASDFDSIVAILARGLEEVDNG